LTNYKQVATHIQIWKAFRRKDTTIDIASDGGLANTIGTFGWKIVAIFRQNEQVLYQGAGTIDGPTEVGSSTRSELGGLTAPLLLATTLAKFWGIRHKCQFRWLTDSTSAISKVRMYTVHGRSQRYPDHSDYVLAIQELAAELKRPIAAQWVKGHQDEDRPYDELTREAKLNVDVDALATTQYDHISRNPPMRSIDHLPNQKITLTINGKRFPSNWDVNVRWSINGT
jgi:ribonuclease HI